VQVLNQKPELSELVHYYNDKYAQGYMGRDSYGAWSHSGAPLLRVLETLGRVSIVPDRILDYGCGQGAWIDILSQRFPNSQICGLDISNVAVENAKAQFPSHEFKTFDGKVAEFPDEHFDLVFSYHVLEHVVDVQASIVDICRMLKKGGYACIIFPCANRGSFEEKAMNWIDGGITINHEGRKVYLYEQAVGHLRRMTSSEVVGLFENAGLTLVSEFYSGQFLGWVDWLVRAHDRSTISFVLREEKPINYWAKVKLSMTRRLLLALSWIVEKRSVNLSKRRA
jgi:ubiquinone/menaquinone biosynthesis C-methylase UbiE